MAIFTPNLNIPKLEPQNVFDVVKDVNAVIDAVDENALPINHKQSKSHFDMWMPNTVYKKGDVVRTSTIPSWGFFEATQNDSGTSGTAEPVGYGIGDTFADNTITWTLQKIGGRNIGNLLGENSNGDLTYKGVAVYKDTRTIVFMGAAPQIAYPYKGTIEKLTVLCSALPTTAADFTVQKISSAGYTSGGGWTIMGSGTYSIDVDKNYLEWTLEDNNALLAGDIVRISSDAKNLDTTVFQLYVKNY